MTGSLLYLHPTLQDLAPPAYHKRTCTRTQPPDPPAPVPASGQAGPQAVGRTRTGPGPSGRLAAAVHLLSVTARAATSTRLARCGTRVCMSVVSSSLNLKPLNLKCRDSDPETTGPGPGSHLHVPTKTVCQAPASMPRNHRAGPTRAPSPAEGRDFRCTAAGSQSARLKHRLGDRPQAAAGVPVRH